MILPSNHSYRNGGGLQRSWKRREPMGTVNRRPLDEFFIVERYISVL